MKPDVLPLWLAAFLYLWQAKNYYSAEQYGMMLGFILAAREF